MKVDYPLQLMQCGTLRNSEVQVGIVGTEVAIGRIHVSHVDDVIKAVNSSKITTKIERQFILPKLRDNY